jgi:hypothetical protein
VPIIWILTGGQKQGNDRKIRRGEGALIDKVDYLEENISIIDFYHALSKSLKSTSKNPFTVFEQLLDVGLRVSAGHTGYVDDIPIHPGDIKVALRKAARKGKQGEEIFGSFEFRVG